MKYTGTVATCFFVAALLVPSAAAQDVVHAPETSVEGTSASKAFALSLVVPGLGHRHVHGGDWDGWASVFAAADAGLWAGLFGVSRYQDHLVESYRTLASQHAGVNPAGKDRDFYLDVATYRSSEDYVDALLRNRNWSQLEAARDPGAGWDWDTEAHFLDFGEAREKGESLRRRRTFIITSLVANRLIAGITALRAARRTGTPQIELSFALPPHGAEAPLLRLTRRFK